MVKWMVPNGSSAGCAQGGNGDYVACSAFPGNGICAKFEGDPARGPLRDAQRSKEIPQVDGDIWKRL